ncbi:MAG TPA: glycosyl transferase [Candidatus Thioglobus sp.]|nr:glycosyl transferase [Candidatus Thioglobus sp.]HIL42375.1 glycosyl transferase [Gammaproteobacteria bacterium]
MTKKYSFTRWLKYLTLVNVLFFSLYLIYLGNTVVSTFSIPIPNENNAINYKQQSTDLVNMLLITEDQSFFQHHGVDFKEIYRVLSEYVLYKKPIRGASTITQQLIKNTLLTREQTLTRKFNEVIMALLLELSFDKEFILNRYMNTVYLGQSVDGAVYGFANASEFYFNKTVKLLSIEEMATLVALLKGPSYYNPEKHPERLNKRMKLVLSLFYKYKKIVP